MIVLMAGLPGTGKSTLARALAARVHGAVLDKDRVRAALFAPEDIEYSEEQDNFCVGLLMEAAAFLLRRNPERVVFVDGRTFSKRNHLEDAIGAVEKIPSAWRILECVCAEETARRRLEADARSGGHPAANRDIELYRTVRRAWEPIALPHTVIDTDRPLADCVEHALSALVFRLPPPPCGA